jgi:hypothetical protein
MDPDTSTKTWLRVALTLFGVFLSAQAVWILLAERHRLNHIRLPVDGKIATMAFAEQDNIKQAASLAVVRGGAVGRKRVYAWPASSGSIGRYGWMPTTSSTGGTKNFDPSPAILTATRGRLAHVRGLGR